MNHLTDISAIEREWTGVVDSDEAVLVAAWVSKSEARRGVSYPDAIVLARAEECRSRPEFINLAVTGACRWPADETLGDLFRQCVELINDDEELLRNGQIIASWDRYRRRLAARTVLREMLMGDEPLTRVRRHSYEPRDYHGNPYSTTSAGRT